MIRHILLVRARPDSTAQLLSAFEHIAGLRDRLPGLLDVTSGASKSPEQLERGYTHGLVADFADWESLRSYADHAEHRAAAAQIIEVATGGNDGLLVVDLELAGS